MPRYYIKLYKQQDLEQYKKLYNSIRDKKITPEEGQKILKELWHASTEYKLAKLTKKLQAERKNMMAKEGIITDYTKLNEETLKETELWKKLKRDIRREKKEVTKKLTEKPWDRIEKRKLKKI